MLGHQRVPPSTQASPGLQARRQEWSHLCVAPLPAKPRLQGRVQGRDDQPAEQLRQHEPRRREGGALEPHVHVDTAGGQQPSHGAAGGLGEEEDGQAHEVADTAGTGCCIHDLPQRQLAGADELTSCGGGILVFTERLHEAGAHHTTATTTATTTGQQHSACQHPHREPTAQVTSSCARTSKTCPHWRCARPR